MDIRDFLSRLQGVTGPNQGGEYRAKCPAHDDKTASLCVKEGDGGKIVLCCQAHCTASAVVSAMGLKLRDLFPDDGKGAGGQRKIIGKTDKAGGGGYQWDSYERAYKKEGTFVCVYRYTDENGALLFEVARIRMADGKKTMRQHRPADANKGPIPFIKGVPDKVRFSVLYRLPEVIKAKTANKPIYVVEGEKDADTLARLGYTATTNACGAGNWKSTHSAWLNGADVIIIPDNDEAGKGLERAVIDGVIDTAKSVRAINLKDGWPTIPEHGDVTDMIEALGDQHGKEIIDQLVRKAAPLEPDERQRIAAMYASVGGYVVSGGCICAKAEDSDKRLGTFLAYPRRELIKDDGVTRQNYKEIDGWSMDGEKLPTVVIPGEEFDTMRWPTKFWGYQGNISPGNTIRDKLRYCIGEVGRRNAQRVTVYAHTGWRKIRGSWCYLYQGGAIGAEGVTVDLGAGLTNYTLDDVPDGSFSDAAMKSYLMTLVVRDRVSIPLLGTIYLAPLREFLAIKGVDVGFSLFIVGRTGTRKSTAAALALSHFGKFTSKTLSASFNDTTNYIRKKAFYVKDSMLVVDDYHPTTSMQEKRRLGKIAQDLSRAFGDGAGRGRMQANTDLQESMPPRSLAVMTGEEMPPVGDSGAARYYVVRMEDGDVPLNDGLTTAQDDAAEGWYRLAMRGYLEWVITQADTLPGVLMDDFRAMRKKAQTMAKDAHPRAHEAMAMILLGLKTFYRYMVSMDQLGPEAVETLMGIAWEIITTNSVTQADEQAEEKPVNMFMRAIREMLTSHTATVLDMGGAVMGLPEKGMVGYRDKDYYYFMADSVFGMVTRFYRDADVSFPVGKNTILKDLRDAGIVTATGGDGKTTRLKRTPDGKVARLIWVERWIIDGGERPKIPPIRHQESMDIEGAQKTDDDILPF